MMIKQAVAFLKQHKMNTVMVSLTLVSLVVVLVVLSFVVNLYGDVIPGGESIVLPDLPDSGSGVQQGALNYKELSEAYASLETTAEVWTELTEEAASKGEKGGLHFISREHPEFSIFHADSQALCGKGFTLQNFDHIWMNSEHNYFYVVVNLGGTDIDLSDYYILSRDDSVRYASRVLINCYEATNVDLTNCIFTGTLLAPYATVTCQDTYLYGQILAPEVTGTRLSNKEVSFTGYEAIINGLSAVHFENDDVRRAAIAFLLQHNNDGRYDHYTQDSQVLARDLQEITSLVMDDCMLTLLEQDLKKFPALTSLTIRNADLTEFAPVGLDELVDLEISDTPLESLNLTNVPGLKRLIVDGTELTDLSLSAVPELITLSYRGTPLGWLDYTPVSKLQYLDCSDANIEPSVITGETLPLLNTLRIEENAGIEVIQLDTFSSLERLDCASCAITEINVEDFTRIRYLRCSYNRIKALDFSSVKQIYSVECYGDSLQTMIVTNWAEKAYADCPITRVYE
ncbi:MAG: choice-of-anchor A family protein [Clostridia bacterium]|nr:choice-of-anchor A family protein [Clostridia bacterium]